MIPAADVIAGASMLAAAAGGAAYYATYAVRSQWLGSTAWQGRTDTASVALTFDDGPTPDTLRILDVLAAHDVRGTFFMIGQRVERHPEIARRVATDGHAIGNHSYSHPLYLSRSPGETRRQLARTQDVIADATGVRPIWSRPPYGVRTPAYFSAARSLRLRTVQWTVAGFDWKQRRADAIARAVLAGIRAGAIVLLHDGATEPPMDRRETAASLPMIIGRARARGLRIASLQDLLVSHSEPAPAGRHG